LSPNPPEASPDDPKKQKDLRQPRGLGAPGSRPSPFGINPSWLRSLKGSLSRNLGGIFATVLVSALLLTLSVKFFQWAVWDATFVGTSKAACMGDGACWPFVTTRLGQFFYGFYPESERWRVNITGIMTAMFSVYMFSSAALLRKTLASVVLIACGFVLLRGGYFALLSVETTQWGGLFLTIVLALTGTLVSLPLGILLALGRRSTLPVVRTLATTFIEVVRGVPLITVLFLASVMLPIILPPGTNFDKLLRALVGITMFAGAYMAEVVRGGLEAIPKGQYEASYALGLGKAETLALVVLPQALRKVVPAIVNTWIGLFKDTTLVLIIGMFDLLGMVQAASTDPGWLGTSMEGYVFAGAVYWIFCFGLSRLSHRLEERSMTSQSPLV
jgi:general L-amino acid transport system permease protein